MPDVRILAGDHRTLADWTLGQICKHLADSFHGSIDGLDLGSHRVKRFLLRRWLLWVTFQYGIPRNYTVDDRLTPREPVKIEEGVGLLEQAIARYQNHTGALRAHPLFGSMDRPTWDRVHLVHCAHHLSFVVAPEPADRA